MNRNHFLCWPANVVCLREKSWAQKKTQRERDSVYSLSLCHFTVGYKSIWEQPAAAAAAHSHLLLSSFEKRKTIEWNKIGDGEKKSTQNTWREVNTDHQPVYYRESTYFIRTLVAHRGSQDDLCWDWQFGRDEAQETNGKMQLNDIDAFRENMSNVCAFKL